MRTLSYAFIFVAGLATSAAALSPAPEIHSSGATAGAVLIAGAVVLTLEKLRRRRS